MDDYIEMLRRWLRGAKDVVTTAPKGVTVMDKGVSNLAGTQGMLNKAAGSSPGLSPMLQKFRSFGLPSQPQDTNYIKDQMDRYMAERFDKRLRR